MHTVCCNRIKLWDKLRHCNCICICRKYYVWWCGI